jgi:signal transduction histidine kinase
VAEALTALESADAAAVAAHWAIVDPGAVERLPLLARKLARLAQLEGKFAETLEREKLESLKQLAYGAGHEINNPLANISVRAQTLLKQETDPERRRTLAAINAQVYRAHEMIADLMLFSRPPKLQAEPVDLVELIERVRAELADEAAQRGAVLKQAEAAEPVIAEVDRVQLGVALRAICVNALEATGLGGRIELAVRPADVHSGARITISDNGPGISPEVRRHLFDPFYSGREAGRGLGFGLSKSWRIITDHGGRIDVENPPNGAQFVITLPAGQACAS